MDKHKKIVFLHIPKTAGQSVHHFLVDSFPHAAVCPARVNDELLALSRKEINNYQIFSGHFDWCLLDCLEGDVFTFTVLRDPLERILSYYFFMRRQASAFTPDQLKSPYLIGQYYALNATPYEYMVDPKCAIRDHLDSMLDNVYTYFFAARRYKARGYVLSRVGKGLSFPSMSEVVALAVDNLRQVDKIYMMDTWGNLKSDLEAFVGYALATDPSIYRLNRGEISGTAERLSVLTGGERGQEVANRLKEFTEYDRHLWDIAANTNRE